MAKGLRKIEISVGESSLTHFGGVFLIQWFCKKLRLKWHLQDQIRIFQPGKLYHPTELMLAIIYAVICGIHRINRTKILQGNGSFQRIIGLKTFPYASSLRRFLKRANPKTIQGICKVHDYLRLKMFYLPKARTSLLLDFDSTVLTIYGKYIEEAKVGYNPQKRGARSYHPLLCFESHRREFWHGILRPGDAYTSTGSVKFLEECLEKIPPYVYRVRVRADSGFFDHKFIEPLDDKCIGYAIVAKLTPPIKRKIQELRYHHFRKDWGVSTFQYQPHGWEKPHRFIVIRRKLAQKQEDQLNLFTLKQYSYQVFVSNLLLNPENIWHFYKGRANIEKHIRELKEDYALAKIPTKSFQANQMYFHLLVLAYNIINWFRRICLPQKYQKSTLQTIRSEILVLPARLVNIQHKNVLKLPKEYIPEKTLNGIIQRIEKMKSL